MKISGRVGASGSVAAGEDGVAAPTASAAQRPATRSVAFALGAMRGQLLGGPVAASEALFAGAAVDTRLLRPGEIFFALPGERVDGHDFCAAAVAAGAAALVVEARRGIPAGIGEAGAAGTIPGRGAAVPVIGVEAPLVALGDLARAVRSEFRGAVVGITGSNGKTTTKELTAAALGAAGAVARTQGNFNTEIGLPLTILAASGQEAFWVLEMAMRGRGQIALLADIARPHVGVITNVAAAHVELLGSIEEVARAKGELFAGLGADGIAVLPGGDELIEAQASHLPESRKVRFQAGSDAGPPPPPPPPALPAGRPRPRHPAGIVDVVILESLPAGVAGQVVRYAVRDQPVVARLPLGGMHNARNGAAALAVAIALGLPVPEAAQALAGTVLPPHRSFPRPVAGRIVLDDCYNANPSSMRAALAAVATAAASGRGASPGSGRAFAILGDMLELGPDAVTLHRELGREVAARLGGLATVGALGAEIAAGAREAGLDAGRVVAVDDPAAAAAAVAAWSRPGDWVLVKASRGMRLERAIDALMEEFRKQPRMT